MQTVMLEVNDNYLGKFMALLEALPKDEVRLKRDPLRDELKRRLEAIDSGQETMRPLDDDYSKELDTFIEGIQ